MYGEKSFAIPPQFNAVSHAANFDFPFDFDCGHPNWRGWHSEFGQSSVKA